MKKIQAIETKYQGYRFRSRLEARWAIFFDMMGYEWEYEPEGFVLEDGTYYLPDFKIHTKTYNDAECWIEVKATKFNEEERKKCELLSKGTDSSILLAVGTPDFISYESISNYGSCGVIFDNYKYGLYISGSYQGREEVEGHFKESMRDAIYAARGARFEHGESEVYEQYIGLKKIKGDYRNKNL